MSETISDCRLLIAADLIEKLGAIFDGIADFGTTRQAIETRKSEMNRKSQIGNRKYD